MFKVFHYIFYSTNWEDTYKLPELPQDVVMAISVPKAVVPRAIRNRIVHILLEDIMRRTL